MTQILGQSVDIIVDANQAWSVDQSIRILRELGDRFAVCEQPNVWDDMTGLAEITSSVDGAVMADEAVWSPYDASILVRLKATDFVNIKHLKSGGLHYALEIAKTLDSAGTPYMIGSTMESSISSAASMHLGLVCPGLKYFDVSPPTTFLVEDIAEGLTWNGCDVQPNEMSGLGLKLKDETIAKYRIS